VSEPGLRSYGEIIDLLDALPTLIRETRRRKGLTLRQAEKVLGLSYATISRYETGTQGPDVTNLRKILLWMAT
jgi:transcriptional regulator with XRE-family HTH domain